MPCGATGSDSFGSPSVGGDLGIARGCAALPRTETLDFGPKKV